MNTSTFKSAGVRWEEATPRVINRTFTHMLKVVVPTNVSYKVLTQTAVSSLGVEKSVSVMSYIIGQIT